MKLNQLQWQASEFTFTASADYADALDVGAVRFTATFSGPSGQTIGADGFWDGERSWKIRFAPPTAGAWSYTTRFTREGDSGLHGRHGAFDVSPAAGDNPLYRHGGFLRASPNQRHLTYTDGTPFFWLGDTWWFCPSDLMPFDRSNRPGIESMFRHLVDLRASQGYTTIHMAFLGPSGVRGNYEDVAAGKWSHEYWDNVDRYLRYATDRGLIPVVGLGFHRGMDKPSLDELQRIWAYFLARYAAWPITFLICGEYNLANGATEAEKEADGVRPQKILALGRFIREHDPYARAMTVHPWWHGGDKRQAWDEPWYGFIMIQGGHSKEGPPASAYREMYARDRPKPLLEGECAYEGIFGFSAGVVRHVSYKAIQCGSFGFTYGAQGLWYPTQDEQDQRFAEWGTPKPWWQAMALEGGDQMRHLRACYESVAWWRLEPLPEAVPDCPALLVKADEDRVFLVWYAAGAQTGPAPMLHGARPGARYTAGWFDPRTGVRRALPAVLASTHGLPLPAAPDAQDWMLILKGEIA